MNKSAHKMEEFLEFRLKAEAMQKIHGGDSPIPPDEPPIPPPRK